jgi:hypothetical protein
MPDNWDRRDKPGDDTECEGLEMQTERTGYARSRSVVFALGSRAQAGPGPRM